MLSKLFHKKTSMEKPSVPRDQSTWPREWNTVFFKTYPRFDAIALPDVLELQNLETALKKRKSARSFDTSKDMPLEKLSTILFYAAGLKGDPGAFRDTTPEEKNGTMRFYPSGGRRYPLELYVAIKRVTGVPPGVYHYNVVDHSLERLLGERGLLDFDSIPIYPFVCDAAVTFITTAAWNRNFMKYGDFGYNLVVLEAGHMNQNLLLVAASLELGCCPLLGFNNDKMNELLDIDRDAESSLYITIAG